MARGGVIILLAYLASGVVGLGVWLVAALVSKYILEGLNFFSHYGLIRLDGEPITSRNTFSSCNPIGNHFTFNLGRHGTHHENADQPHYQFKWKPMPESPYGYITMTLISWIPFWFWKEMLARVGNVREKLLTVGHLNCNRVPRGEHYSIGMDRKIGCGHNRRISRPHQCQTHVAKTLFRPNANHCL